MFENFASSALPPPASFASRVTRFVFSVTGLKPPPEPTSRSTPAAAASWSCASTVSCASIAACTVRLGGRQNFSRSRNHRPNRKTTIGRNRLRTNHATIVISGIDRKQIWPSPTLVFVGGSPGVNLSDERGGCSIDTGLSAPTGRLAAAAASAGKSGSFTWIGRFAVPTGSNGAATRNASVGSLQ